MAESYFKDSRAKRAYQFKFVISRVFLYLFLTLFGLFILTPFVFMIWASFVDKESFNLFTSSGNFSNLFDFSIDNYAAVFATSYTRQVGDQTLTFDRPSFAHFFLNTLIVALSSTAVTVITAVLAAFAFARLEFVGKDLLFTLLLATMMIPGEMMVITNYTTTISLGWENTFAALILVHGVSVFYIFYLRQTFQQIPNELYLAAKVDGVNDFEYLLKVLVPIAMPTIMTIVILSLMGAWNSYIWPSLVANGKWKYNADYDMRLVSNGLMSIFTTQSEGYDSIKIAGSMVVTAPLFVFFLIFHEYIMRGVSRSGIKG